MKKIKLYMVRSKGDTQEYLSTKDYYDEVREATEAEITLEAMAQHLDEAAENCNAHDFVCVHRGLAALMFQELGRDTATRVMRRLINYEGLHGMVGICGKGDVENAEKELGVPLQDWSDWSLTPPA